MGQRTAGVLRIFVILSVAVLSLGGCGTAAVHKDDIGVLYESFWDDPAGWDAVVLADGTAMWRTNRGHEIELGRVPADLVPRLFNAARRLADLGDAAMVDVVDSEPSTVRILSRGPQVAATWDEIVSPGYGFTSVRDDAAFSLAKRFVHAWVEFVATISLCISRADEISAEEVPRESRIHLEEIKREWLETTARFPPEARSVGSPSQRVDAVLYEWDRVDGRGWSVLVLRSGTAVVHHNVDEQVRYVRTSPEMLQVIFSGVERMHADACNFSHPVSAAQDWLTLRQGDRWIRYSWEPLIEPNYGVSLGTKEEFIAELDCIRTWTTVQAWVAWIASMPGNAEPPGDLTPGEESLVQEFVKEIEFRLPLWTRLYNRDTRFQDSVPPEMEQMP